MAALQKVVCIGDVHGHLEKLQVLWEKICAQLGEEFEEHTIVFLGDYVDRGPQVKETLDFLIALKKQHKNIVFLLGNHEFALMGFLGLLPADLPSYAHTWADDRVFFKPGEKSRAYSGPGYEDMHLQGRRYNVYSSASTFRSYGVAYMNRDALLTAMPQSHKDFLRSLEFLHEGIPGYKFVHAGFESTEEKHVSFSGLSVAEQLEQLRTRTCAHRIEPISGREGVRYNVEEFLKENICVVSGHHGRVEFSPLRVIMDESGGELHGTLSAILLPSCLVLRHNDDSYTAPREEIFPPGDPRRADV
eukprot:m.239431 g.239431  ORF g.239431 m.239431 type:complete len:303 (+) comp22543_c0_seq1:63-971(+)